MALPVPRTAAVGVGGGEVAAAFSFVLLGPREEERGEAAAGSSPPSTKRRLVLRPAGGSLLGRGGFGLFWRNALSPAGARLQAEAAWAGGGARQRR